MKLLFCLVGLSLGKNINVNDIKRNLVGNFFDSFGLNERTYFYGDENSLRGLATMATFLQNGASQRQIGSKDLSLEAFDLSVAEFIEKFTNYGCYCWILGPEKGVIGGGQTRDQIDGLCGQLYKCYKCLNLDYGNDQSKFDYDVSLIVGDDGSRKLECHEGDNRDACLCDKMFSEKLSQIDSQCISDMQMGNQNSPFCINEEFRTVNGGGDFDPFDNTEDGCFKTSMHEHNAKDGCCGIYPNRLPYDTMNRECCRKSAQDGDNTFSVDTLVPFGTCEERGGEQVDGKL